MEKVSMNSKRKRGDSLCSEEEERISGEDDAAIDSQWTCTCCTFEGNPPHDEYCGICETAKPPSLSESTIISYKGIHKAISLTDDITVLPVGFGCLACGVGYPSLSARPSPSQFYNILRVVSPPKNSGVHLFVDTADVYCHPFDNRHEIDRQIADAKKTLPLVVSTKSGMNRVSNESTGWREGNRLSFRQQILDAKDNCNSDPTEPLFLWQTHHTNSRSLVSAMTTAKEMIHEKLLSHVGLCNATVGQIEDAVAVLGGSTAALLTVQNEYSLYNLEAEKPLPPGAAASSKKGVLRCCERHGITFVAHSPLGGLKTRRGDRQVERKSDQLKKLAALKNSSPEACAIACLLARGKAMKVKMIVLVGGRGCEHVKESVEMGSRITITEEECSSVMGELKIT